jgi:hypothetical protein
MNTDCILNYLIVISICGVVLFGIISALCFTGVEFLKLEDSVQTKRGIEMIICSIVSIKILHSDFHDHSDYLFYCKIHFSKEA